MHGDVTQWLGVLPPGVLVSYLEELRSFDPTRSGVNSAITAIRTELVRREHALEPAEALPAVGRDTPVERLIRRSQALAERSTACQAWSDDALARLRLVKS